MAGLVSAIHALFSLAEEGNKASMPGIKPGMTMASILRKHLGNPSRRSKTTAMGRTFRILLCAAGLFVAAAAPQAAALSFDEARASCIAKVRPRVIMCMAKQAIAQGGPLRAYVAECREPVRPIVQQCVFRALAASGHPAFAGRTPRMGDICPLGFEGCYARCNSGGGFGGALPPMSCARVCGRRCAPPA